MRFATHSLRVKQSALFLALALVSRGSHYLAAEIDLHFIAGDQYEVRLLLWHDCSSTPAGASALVEYDSPCGTGTLTLPQVSNTDVSPLCDADMAGSSCNGGALPGIERIEYATLVNLVPCDAWGFRYVTCCLTAANNLSMTTVELVTHTTLNNLDLPCRSTPRFAHPALPYRSSNSPFTLDMIGVIDGPGTAQYGLVNLLTSGGGNAPYATPFYTGTNPYPGLTISGTTGVMTTSSTASFGYWVLVPKLRHFVGGIMLASVERVFAMPTSNLTDQPPLATDGALTYLSGAGSVTGDRTIEVPPGGTICAAMSFSDPNSIDSVFLTTDIATALPGASIVMTDGNAASADFCWTAPIGNGGMYHFIVLASDERCPVDQDQYYLYSVHVVPDLTNPCVSTSVPTPAEPDQGSLLLMPDPSWSSLRWSLPPGERAGHIVLYDPQGRVVVDRVIAPADSGTIDLPRSLGDGSYVILCGDRRARLVIAR